MHAVPPPVCGHQLCHDNRVRARVAEAARPELGRAEAGRVELKLVRARVVRRRRLQRAHVRAVRELRLRKAANDGRSERPRHPLRDLGGRARRRERRHEHRKVQPCVCDAHALCVTHTNT